MSKNEFRKCTNSYWKLEKASLCKLFSCTYYRMLWLFCQVKILCVCVCVVCGWSLYDCSSEIEWEWKFVCERKRENVCVCVCVRCHEQTTVYLFHFKILSLEISCLCFFLSLHTKIVLSGWRSALGLGETALVSAHFPPLGALNLRLGESILKFHKRIEKKKNSLVRLLKYKYRNKLRINSKQTNYNSEHE